MLAKHGVDNLKQPAEIGVIDYVGCLLALCTSVAFIGAPDSTSKLTAAFDGELFGAECPDMLRQL